jgi:hypothetical protein
MKCRMATRQPHGVCPRCEALFLYDCDGGLYAYIKQEMNLEKSRSREISCEFLDSGYFKMHTGRYVSY